MFRSLFLSLFVIASLGCVPVLHTYKPIAFHVIDGETGKPIPNARGGVSYERQWLLLNTPADDSAQADVNGRLVLQVNELASQFGWVAPDYQPHNGFNYVPGDPAKAGVRVAANGEFIVPLYREREPVLALQIPQDFRGLIAVELTPTDLLSLEAGKREFKIPLSAGGYAAIESVPIFERVQPSHWTYVKSDGSIADPMVVSREPIQFLWVYSFSERPSGGPFRYHFFVVGKIEERERAKRLLFDIEGEGTKNLFKDSPAKRARLVEMLRSSKTPVSVAEAERVLRGVR